ncbi:hypothetical protein H696_03556 [Fonticula alba]|uniref:adenylate cyclase n=1 Tax=Fonticula alba TaxID=691883 RepID=A0A058Z735_FONAL|nr:hypothetical protein H696_03556 [Fonticula alba]KCV70094.1 hypothetical protein H696_03556 [Fonticula alba]|eukprot:XP_009495700.1 hypothetical protein H696_03556 [Fonticula alba]
MSPARVARSLDRGVARRDGLARNEWWIRRSAFRKAREIQLVNQKSELLLEMLLPKYIRRKISETPNLRSIAESFPHVAVIFLSVTNFRHSSMESANWIEMLNELAVVFDEVMSMYGALKIKFGGATWLAIAGGPADLDPKLEYPPLPLALYSSGIGRGGTSINVRRRIADLFAQCDDDFEDLDWALAAAAAMARETAASSKHRQAGLAEGPAPEGLLLEAAGTGGRQTPGASNGLTVLSPNGLAGQAVTFPGAARASQAGDVAPRVARDTDQLAQALQRAGSAILETVSLSPTHSADLEWARQSAHSFGAGGMGHHGAGPGAAGALAGRMDRPAGPAGASSAGRRLLSAGLGLDLGPPSDLSLATSHPDSLRAVVSDTELDVLLHRRHMPPGGALDQPAAGLAAGGAYPRQRQSSLWPGGELQDGLPSPEARATGPLKRRLPRRLLRRSNSSLHQRPAAENGALSRFSSASSLGHAADNIYQQIYSRQMLSTTGGLVGGSAARGRPSGQARAALALRRYQQHAGGLDPESLEAAAVAAEVAADAAVAAAGHGLGPDPGPGRKRPNPLHQRSRLRNMIPLKPARRGSAGAPAGDPPPRWHRRRSLDRSASGPMGPDRQSDGGPSPGRSGSRSRSRSRHSSPDRARQPGRRASPSRYDGALEGHLAGQAGHRPGHDAEARHAEKPTWLRRLKRQLVLERRFPATLEPIALAALMSSPPGPGAGGARATAASGRRASPMAANPSDCLLGLPGAGRLSKRNSLLVEAGRLATGPMAEPGMAGRFPAAGGGTPRRGSAAMGPAAGDPAHDYPVPPSDQGPGFDAVLQAAADSQRQVPDLEADLEAGLDHQADDAGGPGAAGGNIAQFSWANFWHAQRRASSSTSNISGDSPPEQAESSSGGGSNSETDLFTRVRTTQQQAAQAAAVAARPEGSTSPGPGSSGLLAGPGLSRPESTLLTGERSGNMAHGRRRSLRPGAGPGGASATTSGAGSSGQASGDSADSTAEGAPPGPAIGGGGGGGGGILTRLGLSRRPSQNINLSALDGAQGKGPAPGTAPGGGPLCSAHLEEREDPADPPAEGLDEAEQQAESAHELFLRELRMPVSRLLLMAIHLQNTIVNFGSKHRRDFQVKAGLHVGPLIAGVIGTDKFAYDVWGDTVNVASRMESTSHEGRVQVTRAVIEAAPSMFNFELRGNIQLKGKGRMRTYFLRDVIADRKQYWLTDMPALSHSLSAPTDLFGEEAARPPAGADLSTPRFTTVPYTGWRSRYTAPPGREAQAKVEPASRDQPPDRDPEVPPYHGASPLEGRRLQPNIPPGTGVNPGTPLLEVFPLADTRKDAVLLNAQTIPPGQATGTLPPKRMYYPRALGLEGVQFRDGGAASIALRAWATQPLLAMVTLQETLEKIEKCGP